MAQPVNTQQQQYNAPTNYQYSNKETPELLQLINDFSSNNGKVNPNWNAQQILALLGYYSSSNNIFNSNGDTIAYLNTVLQQFNRDEDYSRTNPAAITEMLQSLGMSRTSALTAAENATSATTPVTPQGANPPTLQPLTDLVGSVSSVANIIMKGVSLPFDLKSKAITNRILESQGGMLDMQMQGMQDAAEFLQACANGGCADKSPLEQYEYILNSQKPRALENGYNLGTVMYGASKSFKRAASNPYFWSTLADMNKENNLAAASVFAPAQAEQSVSSLRAATRYTQNQANTELTRNRIMSVQAFRDETLAAAREDMERAKLLAEKNGYTFDSQRAEQFIERLQQFNSYDFAAMDYEIQKLTYMRDPAMIERQRLALSSELDYNVAMYLYGRSIYSLKNGVLAQMNPTLQNSGAVANLDSHVGSTDDLIKWTRSYLEYCELGRTAQSNARQGIARTIFSGLGAAAGTAFVGLKLFKGVQGLQAANAAANAASVVQSGAPSIPFNLTTPLVISAPLAPYLLPQVNDLGM